MRLIIPILFTFILLNTSLVAQQKSPSVQITGIVIDRDSLNPVAFTSIVIKHTTKGIVSDGNGYFSIFANELDTLEFSNVGYRTSTFVVPPNLPKESYGLVQVMEKDTLVLEEVTIYPWPAPQDFTQAFLTLEAKPNLHTRSFEASRKLQKTLDKQLAREKFYYNQMRYSRLYSLTGEIPPNNFLNPITWSNFIKDWKNEAFKTDQRDIPDMNR